MKVYKRTKQHGIALLVALLAVSVALPIGLSLLDSTIKQVRLASLARDSEIAFTAAEAAAECAQVVRNRYIVPLGDPNILPAYINGGDMVDCFGSGDDVFEVTNRSFFNVAETVILTEYESTWGAGVCSEFDVYLMRAYDVTGGIAEVFPGDVGSHSCAEGDTCTVIVARGYNRECGSLDSSRTAQRELILKF